MGTVPAFGSPSQHTVAGAAYRLGRAICIYPAANCRRSGNQAQAEGILVVPLLRVRAVERAYNLLGLQCNRRRRNFRDTGQLASDVGLIRPVPFQPQTSQVRPAVYTSRSGVDCLGKALFQRADILAVARARKRICRHHTTCAVVRVDRNPWRLALGMARESWHFRDNGDTSGRNLAFLDRCSPHFGNHLDDTAPGAPCRCLFLSVQSLRA